MILQRNSNWVAGQKLDYNTFKEQIDDEEGEAIGFYLPTQGDVQEGDIEWQNRLR